jgi:replicative DNA helicase
MTDCTGWTAEEIVRDMVHKRWDVVGVDTLGQFPGARRRENLEEISRVFNEAVTPTRANCHLILATTRTATGPARHGAAVPALADIRDSGQLADDADNVLFVHRDQDEDTGEPMASGVMRFAKVRNGRLGGMQVTFEAEFQRFEERAAATAATRPL